MKTKFIVHGGYAGHINKENDAFFREILKDAPKETHVLLNYFAKGNENHSDRIRGDKLQFENNKGDRILSFDVSEEDKFIEQIKRADVIYLHGGTTPWLIDKLKQIPDLAKLFEGKIVAGESAGAYALSTCFYSKSEKGIFSGLGFVPTKIICHYIGKNVEKLDECPNDLETLLLKDYEFKVFE